MCSTSTNGAARPRDCALAIALPLDEERFLGDLQSAEHDYASYIRSLHAAEGADDEYYWDVVYGPLAALMTATLDDIERLGVTVVRDATLDDFRRLAARFPIVTLVSHWCFRELRAEEILDVDALKAALAKPPSDLASAFRDELQQVDPFALCAGADRNKLAEAFNCILAAGHREYAAESRAPLLLMKIPAWRFTRPTFETAYGGIVEHGRAVEFADGMKTTAEVVAALPHAYAGFLDMTICNSVIVGEVIKCARPHCIVAVNRYPTEPHIRLMLYRRMISRLRRRPEDFRLAMSRAGDLG